MKYYERKNYTGLLYISPWIFGFLLFKLYPFVMSLVYSFTEFNILDKPKFIGFDNYIYMFTRDKLFFPALKNTLAYVFMTVPMKLAFALFIAVLLNLKLKNINIFRTAYYLPSIFGGSVAVSILWRFLFMKEGIINKFIGFFSIKPVDWLGNPDIALFTVSLLAVWQFGSSMVIFLAALKQIPNELYEAAIVDGASKLKRIWHIDLPSIQSTIIILMIMSVGSIMSTGFEKIYLMQNNLNLRTSEVIDTYVYKIGLASPIANYSFPTAIGLFQSVIGLLLIVIVNKIAQKVSEVSLW